jgi:hypothetical protein
MNGNGAKLEGDRVVAFPRLRVEGLAHGLSRDRLPIYGNANAINESPRLGSNSWLPPVAATTTYCFPFLP